MKIVRIALGWTMEEMGAKLGVKGNTYSKWEYGLNAFPKRLHERLLSLKSSGRPPDDEFSRQFPASKVGALAGSIAEASFTELPVRRGILAGSEGDECYFTSSDDGTVMVPSFLLGSREAAYPLYSVAIAAGNSMRERIQPGNHLVVRREDDSQRLLNHLVIALDEDRAREYVKVFRWNVARDLAELHSLNDSYPPITVGSGWRTLAGVMAVYDPLSLGSKNIEFTGEYLRG